MQQWFNNIFGENKSIAVIGNSIGAIKDNVKEKIERYDVICRFNNYQINGYEERIGRRTDLYVTTLTNWQEKSYEQLLNEKIRAVYVTRPLSAKYIYNVNLPVMLTNLHNIRKFKCRFVEEETFNHLYQLLGFVNDNSGKNPTSGLTFLYEFISNVKFNELYITGFDFFSHRNSESNVLHYYQENREDYFSVEEIEFYHFREREKSIFCDLIANRNNITISASVRENLKNN